MLIFFRLQECIWSDVFPVQWRQNEQKQKSEQWCENWLRQEKDLLPVKIHAPYCPCVVSIAENDVGHFTKDPICDNSKDSVINCEFNPNAHKCFRRNLKRFVWNTLRKCFVMFMILVLFYVYVSVYLFVFSLHKMQKYVLWI